MHEQILRCTIKFKLYRLKIIILSSGLMISQINNNKQKKIFNTQYRVERKNGIKPETVINKMKITSI